MRGGKKIARPENLHRLCGWRTGRVAYTKPPTHTSAGRKIDSRRVHRRGPLRWMFMRCGCFATFPSYFFASRRRRRMCRFVMNPTLNRSTKTRKVLSKQRTVSFFQSAKANKFVLIVEPLDYTMFVWRVPSSSRQPQPRYMLVYLCFRSFYQHSRKNFFSSVSTIKQPKHTSQIYLIYVLWKLIWWLVTVGGEGAGGILIKPLRPSEWWLITGMWSSGIHSRWFIAFTKKILFSSRERFYFAIIADKPIARGTWEVHKVIDQLNNFFWLTRRLTTTARDNIRKAGQSSGSARTTSIVVS